MASYFSALNYYDMVRGYVQAGPMMAMLVTSEFSFNPEAHQYRSSVFNELSGGGYATGGVEVPDANVLLDTTNNAVEIVGSDVDFGLLTAADIGSMIIYISTGATTADRIIAAFTFPKVTRDNESFIFFWDAPSRVNPALGTIARLNY